MQLLIFGLIMMVLGAIAQNAVQGSYDKYAKKATKSGLTGAQAARALLDQYGLQEVRIEESKLGHLSDHYDPTDRVLRLSKQIAETASIAAVGVAAHEAGHALQHAESFPPLMLRTRLARLITLGAQLTPFLFWAGLILSFTPYRGLGMPIFLVSMVVYGGIGVMSLVTLPVEFDASNRARQLLYRHKIIDRQELTGVNNVLSAAAWTYVVGALNAVLRMIVWKR
jgi:Zn-dependent membrane protease YugP